MLSRPEPKSIDRKARLRTPSRGVPKQPPDDRRANFEETYLPLDPEMAAEFPSLSVFETDVAYPAGEARQEADMEIVEL